jgi:hypothetical protein
LTFLLSLPEKEASFKRLVSTRIISSKLTNIYQANKKTKEYKFGFASVVEVPVGVALANVPPVPAEQKPRVTLPQSIVEGDVEIVGVIRPDDTGVLDEGMTRKATIQRIMFVGT